MNTNYLPKSCQQLSIDYFGCIFRHIKKILFPSSSLSPVIYRNDKFTHLTHGFRSHRGTLSAPSILRIVSKYILCFSECITNSLRACSPILREYFPPHRNNSLPGLLLFSIPAYAMAYRTMETDCNGE